MFRYKGFFRNDLWW